MSSGIDDAEFDEFMSSDISLEEFLEGQDRSHQTNDQTMSGINEHPSTNNPDQTSTSRPVFHSPSPLSDDRHLQQNPPNMPSPEHRREESPSELFIPETPRCPENDFGNPAGLDDHELMGDLEPELNLYDGALQQPQLASPIAFASLFGETPARQTIGNSSRRNASASPPPPEQDSVPEEPEIAADPIQQLHNESQHSRASSPAAKGNAITQVDQSGDDNMDIQVDKPSDDNLNTQVDQPTVEDDDVPMINPEDVPKEVPPPAPARPASVQQMMAAQRAMIQGSMRNDNTNKASTFGARKSVEAESSHRRRPSYAEGGDEHENAKVAMGDGEDDHSWMEEEDSSRDEEYDNLVTVRNSLQARAKNGKITQDDKLELFNVMARLKNKDHLLKAAARVSNEQEEESLFVEDSREKVVERHIIGRPTDSTFQSGDDDDLDEDLGLVRMLKESINGGGMDGEGNAKKTKGRPRKKATEKRPSNAREVREQEARREKERAKAQKTKRAPAGKAGGKKSAAAPKGRGKGKGKGKAASSRGYREPPVTTRSDSLLRPQDRDRLPRDNTPDKVGQTMLENLFMNDPIGDRLNHPAFDVEPEPVIEGKQTKSSQFQKLFANIPSGGNKAIIRDDKKKLQEASRSFGHAKVAAVNGKWLVKGMTSPLYHHQLLGAQWMVGRELSEEPPHGGLLADSMGLGKTVQTLACMIGNPPSHDDFSRGIKATLIVVPAAVLDQWVDEIKFHTQKGVFRKIQKYKTSAQISLEVIQDMDIVLTTYNEVMKQFPYPNKDDIAKIESKGYGKWWKDAIKTAGDLHKVNWYRIVLDEAHAIKNNNSRTSLACQNLKSIYRWCLTGSPLLNRLEEMFPYLRFLKAEYSMDMQTFQKYFCDPKSGDSHARIQTLLSYTMMRRTMKTTILGRPIITLPKPHPVVQYIDFSPQEQVIYRITENRFRANINRYFQAHEVRRNYSVFMVQLLRLRQCTSHPFMLERTIKEAWTLEDVDELNDKFQKLGVRGVKRFYDQTKVWVEESAQAKAEAMARGENPEEQLMPFGKGDYAKDKFDMEKAFAGISEAELHLRVNCGFCGDVPEEPMETDCGHLFCKDCLEIYLNEVAVSDEEFNICPTCNSIFATTASREIASDEDEPSQRRGGKKESRKSLPASSKGRDRLGFEPFAESTWLTHSDNDPGFPLAPSAKTAALKSALLRGFEEAPMDKVVIYVQFRLLARIVGRMCKGEGWGFLYFSGDSPLEHRTKATKMFRDDPDVKILISGLKCGGVGLNFPWANRCISLDLWWNHAVEQQAFGRIFRIGQDKETYMTRIVVKNSVDMRLLTMQMHKLQDLEKAISEQKKGLSLAQLANLFGFLRKGEEGEIIGVEADYDDGSGGEGESRDAGGSEMEVDY